MTGLSQTGKRIREINLRGNGGMVWAGKTVGA